MLIDSHAHLQFPQFDKDRAEVIKRALDNGVRLVNVGADKESSVKAVELAKKYKEGVYPHTYFANDIVLKKERLFRKNHFASEIDITSKIGVGVYATVGVHPHGAGKDWDYGFFKKLSLEPKVVAIGECGLDYFRIKNQELGIMEKQKEIFIQQIKLANEAGKPLMIHCREAFNDLISILNSCFIIHNSNNGVVHFFTGSLDDAKKLLELGFYFTFGGLITYNRSFDEIIKFLPLDRILLETDAPYVAPEPYRGKRNEPLYIIETAKKMAEIKGVSFEEVAKQTTENAERCLK